MNKVDVEKIWTDVQGEAGNRSKGSFKRALWYGNNSKVFGQNKGARKAIRNAPKQIALGSLDFAGMAPGLGAAVGMVVDQALSAGKDLYSAEVKPYLKQKPTSADEQLRKQVKSSVKDMKSNAFQVMDRNLVKLKDSGKKVSPSIRDLMAAAPSATYQNSSMGVSIGGSSDDEKQAKKAHDALRQIAETEYYIDKEMGMVKVLQEALVVLEKDLNKMQVSTQKVRKEVMDYIESAL